MSDQVTLNLPMSSINNLPSVAPVAISMPPLPSGKKASTLSTGKARIVNWDAVDCSKFRLGAPVTKTTLTENGQISYTELPIHYNYGTEENPVLDKFLMQYPKVTSPYGPEYTIARGSSGPYKKHSIQFLFDLSNPETLPLLKILDDIHKAIAIQLKKHAGAIKMPKFNPEDPVATGFNSLFYVPIDKGTGEEQKGKSPSQYYKMTEWTPFRAKNGNETIPINLNDISGPSRNLKQGQGQGNTGKSSNDNTINVNAPRTKVIGYPLIEFRDIYASGNGKASTQMHVNSMVVTDLIPRETEFNQLDLLENLPQSEESLILDSLEIIRARNPRPQTQFQPQFHSHNQPPHSSQGNVSSGSGVDPKMTIPSTIPSNLQFPTSNPKPMGLANSGFGATMEPISGNSFHSSVPQPTNSFPQTSAQPNNSFPQPSAQPNNSFPQTSAQPTSSFPQTATQSSIPQLPFSPQGNNNFHSNVPSQFNSPNQPMMGQYGQNTGPQIPNQSFPSTISSGTNPSNLSNFLDQPPVQGMQRFQ